MLGLGTHAPRWLLALFAAFAAARFLIPWFPTDLDRSRPTPAGRIHLLLAAIAFASIAVVAGYTPDDLAPGWLQWTVVGTAIATGVGARRPIPYFGLVERLLYAAMIAWFIVVSAALLNQ
jgi:uncharacterized protein DUF998